MFSLMYFRDLYGAIGFPLKLSRTVIVGKKADLVKKVLYILSYFIRCSDILETSEQGCLETYLEKLNFSVESPCDSNKNLAQCAQTPVNDRTFEPLSPTPVNCDANFGFTEDQEASAMPSFLSMGLDSLLSDGVKSDARKSNSDFNSNRPISDNVSGKDGSCVACERNRNSQDLEENNRFGKSVFYVSSDTCICDKLKTSSANSAEEGNCDLSRKEEIQRKKDSLKLHLIPKNESQDNESVSQTGNSNEIANPLVQLEKCKLSMAEIVEDARIEKVDHSRKAVDVRVKTFLTSENVRQVTGSKDRKLPNHVGKVLSKEEIKSLFRQKGTDSMFNEYFDEDGIETKTIDDVDEKDRVVALPSLQKQRYFSGESKHSWSEDDSIKAPSLPDLTAVKTDLSHSKGDERAHRVRLGSLDQSYKRRRFSLSRQISESSGKNLPGRCR